MTRSAPTEPRRRRDFVARFGATILQGGIAPVPTTLYFYQGELGLSAQEVWFVGYILAHKWDEDLPYPSLAKMAERSGMSRRNLLRIKDGLVGKGLLVLVPRFNVGGGQESNAYDFTALFEQLEYFIRRDGPRGERHDLTGRVGEGGVTPTSPHWDSEGDGVTPASPPGVTDESRPRVTPASPNKEAVGKEADHEESSQVNPIIHIPIRESSSLVEEGNLKGYVQRSSKNDPPPNTSQPGNKAEETAEGLTIAPPLWPEVQLRLRLSLPAEDISGVVRYASLLAYDPTAGTAVVGLPNAHLCQQVTNRLASAIATALSQVSGRSVQVKAVVQPAGRAAAGVHTSVLPPPSTLIARSSTGRRPMSGRSTQ